MRRWIPLLLLFVLAVVVAACAGDDGEDTDVTEDETDEQPDDTGDEEDDGDEPQDGNIDTEATLRVSHLSPPSQWDPHQGASETIDYSYHTPIYDSLIELTPDLELGPMLATDWEVADDGLTITFNLREDVTFHDGEPFNADAVVANLERARTLEGSITQQQLENVTAVEALDEFTVELTLSQRDPTLLYSLAYHQSSRMVSPAALEDPEALARNPVGSGPYTLVEQGEDRAIYERNDDYWDQELVAQMPARAENIAVGSDEARYRALESGEHDVTVVAGFRPELEEIIARDEINFHTFEAPAMHRVHGLRLNYNHPALADPRVRRALNLALDRDALQSLMGEEQCAPTASSFSHDGPWADTAAALDEEYAYDPDRARELLEEAGHADLQLDGLAITVLPLLNDFAVGVQGQLAEVGVDVEIESITPSEARLTWREGDHDLYFTVPGGFPDPHLTFRDNYYGPNAVGPLPEEFLQLEDEASQHPLGSDERQAAYEEVGEYLLEDPVVVHGCQWPVHQLYWDHVGGATQQSVPKLQTVVVLRYLHVLEE